MAHVVLVGDDLHPNCISQVYGPFASEAEVEEWIKTHENLKDSGWFRHDMAPMKLGEPCQ